MLHGEPIVGGVDALELGEDALVRVGAGLVGFGSPEEQEQKGLHQKIDLNSYETQENQWVRDSRIRGGSHAEQGFFVGLVLIAKGVLEAVIFALNQSRVYVNHVRRN